MRAENKLEQDTVTKALSIDIMKSMFYGFFKPNELTKLRKVCKTWYNLITSNLKDYNNNPAWHQLCAKFNPGKSPLDAFESLVNSIDQPETLSTSQLFTKTMQLVDILEQFQQDETREKIYREALVKGNLNLLHYLQTCAKHLELHFFHISDLSQIDQIEKKRVTSLSTYHIIFNYSYKSLYLGYCTKGRTYKTELITDEQILAGIIKSLINYGLQREIISEEPTTEKEMIVSLEFVVMRGRSKEEERLDILCEDNIKNLINQMVEENNGIIAGGLSLADTLITYDDNPDKQLCKADNPYKKILLPPLMLAALLGQTKLVEYLLSQGANLFCVAVTDTDELIEFHVSRMRSGRKWIETKYMLLPEIKYMLLFAYVENLYHNTCRQELALSTKYAEHSCDIVEMFYKIPQRPAHDSLNIMGRLVDKESKQFFLSYIDRVEKTGKGYQVKTLLDKYKNTLKGYKEDFQCMARFTSK